MNNKNIIYSFYEPPLNWGEDYGKITLPTIESYAKKVGADFEIISYFASIKHDVELVFGTKVDKAVYGPFCLSDRPASQLLVKNFPSDEDFRKAISYVKYSNEERDSYNPNWVMKNPEAPRMFMVHDEHLYAYILNKANLNFTPIRLGSREVTTIQNRRIICGTSDEILPSLCYHFAGPEKIKLQDASFLKELETLNPPL